MPRSFDQLNLDPDHGPSIPTEEVKPFLEEIEEMLDDGRWHWAEDTLEGIHETVSRTGRVSDGQRRAVRNIKDRVDPGL